MKQIIVVGAGALGSHLVQFLRNVLVEIRVIDFDRVEMKNVASQFHGKPGVGKVKVEALRQLMDFVYKRTIVALPSRLDATNVAVLLARADLVIDCLDNAASRRLVQAYTRTHGIPCLHGALAPEGAFGRVVWSEQFVIDDEAGDGAATCENGEFLPFIAIVSAYLAQAAQTFIEAGKKIGFSISPGGSLPI